MESTVVFKLKIFLVALVFSAIVFVASVFFIGFDTIFIFGLVIGTGVSILNFNIMVFCSNIVLEKQNALISIIGYIIRFAFYGGAFYLTIMHSYKMAVGCGIGFFTVQIAIFYLFTFRPKFKKTN